jgi:hypothetical protein
MSVNCDYCGQPAERVTGAVMYPHRPDLASRVFFRCTPCDAYVGTHEGTDPPQPLGRLANAELRGAKIRAHAAFDPLWRQAIAQTGLARAVVRREAYKWLAARLGLPARETHIGMLDVPACHRVVEVCHGVRVICAGRRFEFTQQGEGQ